jgi:chromatin remodeling complex protein RSC6
VNNKNIAWINVDHAKYRMKDISNLHLKNILNLLYRGGGHNYFITVDKITNLYNEANKRGIKLDFNLTKLIESRMNIDIEREDYFVLSRNF